MIYIQLFGAFFKTGLFAIGGGLATLPFLYDISEKYGWFDKKALADMLAISESTPGPIGVNMATYAGFEAAGVIGAVTATVGLVLPSVLIILLIVAFLGKYKENRYVQAAFTGVRPAVVALVTAAFVSVLKASVLDVDRFRETKALLSLVNVRMLCVFAGILLFMQIWKKVHPIFWILLGAAAGILLRL